MTSLRRNGAPRYWLSLAALVAVCALWWGFARSVPLVGLIFGVERGQVILDMDFFFVRTVAVWYLALATALAILVVGALLRRREREGASLSALGYRVYVLAALAMTLVTGMELAGRPLTSPGPWIGFGTYAVLTTLDAWRTQRGSRGTVRADEH